MATNAIRSRARKSTPARKASSRAAVRPVDDLRYRPAQHVEALCDHILKGERTRDWVHGVVVQADPKMVAVQFIEDVYLTDGWKIPDRILWFQQKSDHLRAVTRRTWPRRSRR
ncbi:MAG: hypothetical protein WD906_08510 [Anaerolineales bacterium]